MITVELTQTKVTQNKVVYTSPQDEAVPVSSIYIRKDALNKDPRGHWPAKVTVLVEVAQ
ncbi:hypothetical protein [Actinoplanes sp. NPDC049599]|uniref:hypothetical protein n=1 Tax=Actinoplanes sp. NPDC049599 TaxID=3363903 RepID=UPI0037B572C2